MVNLHSNATNKLIEAIKKEVEKAGVSLVKKGSLDFTGIFYELAPAEEIEAYSVKDLSSIAVDSFKFIKERATRKPKIRIFTPNKKENGWDSEKTIVEILSTDMPFLVDSITEEINRHSYHILSMIHPVIDVQRDKKGELQKVSHHKAVVPEGEKVESFMHLQISHLSSKQMAELKSELLNTLKTVDASVQDWEEMLKKVGYVTTELAGSVEVISQSIAGTKSKYLKENSNEIKEFLEWLRGANFVFLGYIEYDLRKSPKVVPGSELGVLKLYEPSILPKMVREVDENPLAKKNQTLLEITKANRRSVVHRPVHMDYIGIKYLDESGKVIGEHKFLGLFTSSVYYQSTANIPIIRRKVEAVKAKSGFALDGHSGKALVAVLEDLPRDDLLQSSEDHLFKMALGIVFLTVQPKVRLFVRQDDFERFMSCIIFVPRDRMSTELRYKMEAILEESFNGTISNHYTQITESHLARVQIIVKTKPGKVPEYNIDKVEEKLANVARKWTDALKEEFFRRLGDKAGIEYYKKYDSSFSLSYQNKFTPLDAYYDMLQMEKIAEDNSTSFDIYESTEGTEEIFEFKIYNQNEQIPLSRIMPIMENLGLNTLDEHTYFIEPKDEIPVWIHRFRFIVAGIKKPELKDIKTNFEEAIQKTWSGAIQNDGLNKLILKANLAWRDVVLLRAYSKFLQQSSFAYSQAYIQESLGNHPEIAKILVELFYCRFSPEFKFDRENAKKKFLAQIEAILNKVSNLAEDKVVRGMIELITSTQRTNYFQKNAEGDVKDYISFKFKSSEISWLPQPKPYAEIFVYSSRVEGVHLRGGKVARGGLRWSDRREDFRTEVLGLMKAQMTKNSVIIPVGSKGGFVVKNPPAEGGREAFMQEGVECYKTFLRGLLDVTDNIVAGKLTPPNLVVRHDNDDPYLVVAADKGTATFSDIANSVSEEYNFWLGDAFASGGSVGYDHKKMGITAKGAWVSVTRHFAEMGLDVNRDDFTVAGIGDMGGDVFGNGMLLSKHIKLVAAFNHMHIFIDPNPPVKESYKERKRLFNLPRSSWLDYDKKLISDGGAIFERSAKSIKLNDHIKELLNIERKEVTPDELIGYILRAQVDLVWNGGIGTYVKSKTESNEDVGDKANDSLRVNGSELRAKVVGEGGNLGLTQLGRIEYAKTGGSINTDSIDNSAGVDCSDHEVNIKIALRSAIESKKISIEERNKILESMTSEVSELVLRDNVLQTQALTIAQLQGHDLLEDHGRLISEMEETGYLNREIEFLPSVEEIKHRHAENVGLTRPELSVMLAYSKISLYDDMIKSSIPDDPYYKEDLVRYFPTLLQDKFADEVMNHPLKREIVATSVINSILNRIGSSLLYNIKEESGAAICDIARAYTAARDVFKLRSLWDDISALKKIKVEDQKELFVEVQHIAEKVSLWFLQNQSQPIEITKVVEGFSQGVKDLSSCLTKVLPEKLKSVYEARLERYKSFGVDENLAARIAGLDAMASACDIVQVASEADLKVNVVAKVYFELGSSMSLGWIRHILRKMRTASYWQKISCRTLINELFEQQAKITSQVVKHLCENQSCGNAIKSWSEINYQKIERYNNFLEDFKSQEERDFPMIVVAVRKVKEVAV